VKSAEQLDREDALAPLRKSYDLPNDQCYLDGNSLGALSHAVKASIQDVVHREWGETLIGGWNNHGWLAADADRGQTGRFVGRCSRRNPVLR